MNQQMFHPLSAMPTGMHCVRMDFFEDGRLGVLLQEVSPDEELQGAFKAGLASYSYFESPGEVPVAVWTFRFPDPLGLIEVNFDINRTHPLVYEALLNGSTPPVIRFYLRLGGQLMDMTLIEPAAEAWALFQATLQRQHAADYDEEDYSQALEALYEYNQEEIVAMGREFDVSPKAQAPRLIVLPGGKSRH